MQRIGPMRGELDRQRRIMVYLYWFPKVTGKYGSPQAMGWRNLLQMPLQKILLIISFYLNLEAIIIMQVLMMGPRQLCRFLTEPFKAKGHGAQEVPISLYPF